MRSIPFEAALRRAKRRKAEIVVLHVRMLRRAALGEYDLAPDQLFSTIEQLLFTKVLAAAEKEGKPVRLAVVAANDLWEGILRTAENLQSGTIVAGSSSNVEITEQAREIGVSWERMPEPRPRVTLEVLTPTGHEQVFYLGPHAPRLTPKEIDLLHKVWLEFSEKLPKVKRCITTTWSILRWSFSDAPPQADKVTTFSISSAIIWKKSKDAACHRSLLRHQRIRNPLAQKQRGFFRLKTTE